MTRIKNKKKGQNKLNQNEFKKSKIMFNLASNRWLPLIYEAAATVA